MRLLEVTDVLKSTADKGINGETKPGASHEMGSVNVDIFIKFSYKQK
jgi:hypothetical protein